MGVELLVTRVAVGIRGKVPKEETTTNKGNNAASRRPWMRVSMVTCVDTFVRNEVGLVLGAEAARVAQIGTRLAVRHRVLDQRPLRREAACAHHAHVRSRSCKHGFATMATSLFSQKTSSVFLWHNKSCLTQCCEESIFLCGVSTN